MKVIKPLCSGQQERVATIENGGTYMFPLCQVVYCKADRNYTLIYLFDGNIHMDSYTLSNVLKELAPYGFYSIDKSYIVNIHQISCISRSCNSNVTLMDHTVLKISRRKKSALLKVLFS